MFEFFSGKTANDVWNEAFNALQDPQKANLQPSRAGNTKEILHAALTIEDPRQRWVTSRQPPLNPAYAIAEVVWIMNGRNDSKFLNFFNLKLPQFAGTCETYHGAYGYRLRNHFGIDQLNQAYLALQNNPHSRQVVLQIWDSKCDMPAEDGQAINPDIPCNILSLLKVRDNKLEWTQIMRSNDIFLGLPYNFVQFTTLQEIMAGWLNLEVGSYNQISDSLHIYEEAGSRVTVNTSQEPAYNQDLLACNKEDSDKAFNLLNSKTDFLISPSIHHNDISDLINNPELPPAYHNLLLVLAAEASRRQGWTDLSELAISKCSNEIFVQLLQQWFSRVNK